MSEANLTLQVFTKSPSNENVKTRLGAALSLSQRQALQKHLIHHTLSTCSGLDANLELWSYPKADEWIYTNTKQYRVSQCVQQGRNLGERMLNALNTATARRQKTLLLGTDCPGITSMHLMECAKALEQVPEQLVFIPAFDGGFALIASSKPLSLNIFRHVSWSTSSVMATVEHNLNSLNLPYRLLEPLHDVDRPDDLRHLSKHIQP